MGLLFIVFAETGLMFGFFLPGDSLLFVAGIYSEKLVSSLIPGGTGSDFLDLLILFVLVSICGIIGMPWDIGLAERAVPSFSTGRIAFSSSSGICTRPRSFMTNTEARRLSLPGSSRL